MENAQYFNINVSSRRVFSLCKCGLKFQEKKILFNYFLILYLRQKFDNGTVNMLLLITIIS